MNKTMLVLAVSVGLAISACAKKENNKSGPTDPQKNNGATTPTDFEMPKVKYPAAIVFEGGKGDPWFDEDGSKHTAAWRLYICLGKTSEPTSGRVEFDFTKLGNPIEVTRLNSQTNERLYTERLHKVLLAYTYTTELSDTPEKNFGYAYGNATFKSTSTQEWELVYKAPDYNPGPHQSYSDEHLFNIQISSGSLSHFGQKKYGVNGETMYISNWLERFTFSQKDRMSHVIDACERVNESIVWQFGEEIKRN